MLSTYDDSTRTEYFLEWKLFFFNKGIVHPGWNDGNSFSNSVQAS